MELNNNMKSSYKKDDVTLLLKDITGLVKPLPTAEREKLIQSDVHYCEMLPLEYEPSEEYLKAFYYALENFSDITAKAIAITAEKIMFDKKNPAIVSLARAGTPIGILIKNYLEKKYNKPVPHYSISIIRGRGIDKNAMKYILDRHKPEQIQFVDGWTGKGAITSTLAKALSEDINYSKIDPCPAVPCDPAGVARIYGTHKDFLIASSCLNSTVSGLISRTFLRSDIIGEKDFHGAVYYGNLKDKDLTYVFINKITEHFNFDLDLKIAEQPNANGLEETRLIAEHFGINDINLVKPSIGEATRVLLRRIPWKILVHSLSDNKNLGHIYRLAQEKGVKVEQYPLKNYLACGLIKSLADT